jgi:hypothetical protein
MGSPVNRSAVSPSFEISNGSNEVSVATVQAGESNISQVASRLGFDVGQLLQSNPQISETSKLQPGQDIYLPSPAGSGTPPRLEVVSERPLQPNLPPAPVGDPMTRSMVLSKLDAAAPNPVDIRAGATFPGGARPGGASGDVPNLAHSNFVYADANGSGSVTTNKTGQIGASQGNTQACATESPDIKEALTNPPKGSPAREDFAAAQKAIEAGDYTKAYQIMKTLTEVGPKGVASNDDLPDVEQKQADTMKGQLEFLSQMQKAGIKACYPPTESELESYFKTLKNNPSAARQAFQDYAQNFEVHPANIKGSDFEMKYSHETHTTTKNGEEFPVITDTPLKWSDVTKNPASAKDYPQYIGKQMNDCKGYAFMAEKLLGAAGFKLEHYVVGAPSKFGDGHMMAMFSHPGETKLTLTSNDTVLQGTNQRELAKLGFSKAAGAEGNITGKEHYFTGKTGADAEVQQGLLEIANRDGVKGLNFNELPK